MGANCWGAAGAVEGWSLFHFVAASGPEEASAVEVGEGSLSPQAHLPHWPSAETDGGEGAEEACRSVLASPPAAVAVGLQVRVPVPAMGPKTSPELGSGALGVGFHQRSGYWELWCHCFQGMEVLRQSFLVALQAAAPLSACWPSSSSTFGPAGADAAAAAAAASA